MTTPPTSHNDPSPARAPLRIGLRESTSDHGLDGAWWPQSRDLRVEVADLVDNFPDPAARVVRLLFAGSDWVNAVNEGRPAQQVRARHGLVNVGPVVRGGPHRVVLMLATGERLRLRVIASDADGVLAEALLRDAAGGTQRK